MKTVRLVEGNGGLENNALIKEVFYEAFSNDILNQSDDAAILNIPHNRLAFCSDSFTVTPLFFSGGDIGKLAICGTCNDLAMMGAKPKYLTCSVIIEEGFAREELETIVASMKKELAINNAIIVSGDTKVVPRGSVDKIFINTSGIGEVMQENISANNIEMGDAILLSRDVGAHGATIFSAREGIAMQSQLQSDCASLFTVVETLITEGITIHAQRDATRGGVSAVLNEFAQQSNCCIEVEEARIVVQSEVQGLCEMLGFDAMTLANEGTFVLAVAQEDAKQTLEILQRFNTNARLIAKVTQKQPQKVILHSQHGTSRYLHMPRGELLPRIC